jgi:hypothetical protein
MAGRAAGAAITRYAGIQVQTSALGMNVPVGWGTFRCKCNLVWYNDFQAKAQKAASGKGGSTTTGYSYTASLILAICEGPIDAVSSVYVDSSVYVQLGSKSAMLQVGLNLGLGAIGQPVWSYLTSKYPSQAIGYSGLAIAYADSYPLDSSATPPNHSFEVVRTSAFGVAGTPDADPSLVVADFFENSRTGVPSWGAGLLGSLTQYQDYCLAAGLLVSPVIDQQRSASDFLTELLMATNSTCVWSEGLLKFIPYGDTALTGNGKSYTPNVTPVYALNDDDFVVDKDAAPLTVDIMDQSDAYNVVQLEYLDRTNQYNMAIALASDAANVAQYGMRRKDPDTVHCICTPSVAAISAQLFLQRTLYVRAQYKFKLGWMFAILEPGDIVEITDPGLGLAAYPVRIIQIDEDEKYGLSITAEDSQIGIANAPLYTMQNTAGYLVQQNLDPGSVEANLLLYSQDFTQGAWSKNAMTVTAAAAANPFDGLTDAQQVVPTTAAGDHWVYQAVNVFGGLPYTLSGYFAGAGRKNIYLQFASTVPGSAAQGRIGFSVFDGSTFTPAYASGGAMLLDWSVAEPIFVGGEGWYRASITVALQDGDTTANAVVEICDDSGDETWAGDGADGVYAWGLQLSQGLDLRPYAATRNYIAGPMLFNPPSVITEGGLEAWAAVSGGANWGGCNVWVSLDGGDNYAEAGSIEQAARYGRLWNADFPSHADPDTADTLHVDLGMSNGVLTSAANAAADQGATLCLVDNELVCFSTATLTQANRYDLTGYIRRGYLGTPISLHGVTAPLVRLDGAPAIIPFNPAQVGKTVYVKFQSFNLWGRALQSLADCNAYPITLATVVAGPSAAGKNRWGSDLGADVTANNTAAAIAGQGSLATLNAVSATSQVTGLGSLALLNTVSATSQVTGLGALATQNTVNPGQVSPGATKGSAVHVGLQITSSGGTTATITGANLVLNDSNFDAVYTGAVSLTCNLSTGGANGLDTGSPSYPNWYHIWVISNGSTVASLLSLSATSPAMPVGYSYKARVGAVNYSTLGIIQPFIQNGHNVQYVNTTTQRLPLMASGTASLWTAVSTATFVPPTAASIQVLLQGFSINATKAAPNNSYGDVSSTTTAPAPLVAGWMAGSTAEWGTSFGTFTLESSDIYWYGAGSNSALYCMGWIDSF